MAWSNNNTTLKSSWLPCLPSVPVTVPVTISISVSDWYNEGKLWWKFKTTSAFNHHSHHHHVSISIHYERSIFKNNKIKLWAVAVNLNKWAPKLSAELSRAELCECSTSRCKRHSRFEALFQVNWFRVSIKHSTDFDLRVSISESAVTESSDSGSINLNGERKYLSYVLPFSQFYNAKLSLSSSLPRVK